MHPVGRDYSNGGPQCDRSGHRHKIRRIVAGACHDTTSGAVELRPPRLRRLPALVYARNLSDDILGMQSRQCSHPQRDAVSTYSDSDSGWYPARSRPAHFVQMHDATPIEQSEVDHSTRAEV